MSTFTLHVAGPPSNDNCENATPINLSQNYYGSTLGATGSSTSSCGLDDTADVWYSYTAQNNGFVRFHLEDTDYSCGLPITIALYDDCQGNELACSKTGLNSSCNSNAEIGFVLTQGHTYYIRIARDSHSTGNYLLNAVYLVGHPQNDLCTDAIPVNLHDGVSGSTLSATGSDITSCGDNDTADVWYSFTPEDSGTVYFFVINARPIPGPCMTIALFDNCEGSELACGQCTCFGSQISYEVVQGQTYYIRVSRSNNLTADFELIISDVSLCGGSSI
jgi:hypothetical protein